MENTNARAWVLTIGILLIFAIGACGVVWVVRDTIQRTVSPVQDATGSLGTRVAEVLNPTPTILPDPITIVRGVRSLARLETIQYSVEKVITAETGQGTFGFLFGDQLIFVAHGVAIGGVDMEKLGPEDLEIRDGTLFVTLPEAEVFLVTLDNEKSYVYNRDTGVLSRGDVNLETTVRQAAEIEIEKAVLEDGILVQAQQNAENMLYRMFRELGFEDVVFVEPEPGPATPVPATPLPAQPTPLVTP